MQLYCIVMTIVWVMCVCVISSCAVFIILIQSRTSFKSSDCCSLETTNWIHYQATIMCKAVPWLSFVTKLYSLGAMHLSQALTIFTDEIINTKSRELVLTTIAISSSIKLYAHGWLCSLLPTGEYTWEINFV